jgi:hypothetical protein
LNIAKTFKEYIGEPKNYKDGPFMNIVRICYNASGFSDKEPDHIYPDRPVKAALAALKNS